MCYDSSVVPYQEKRERKNRLEYKIINFSLVWPVSGRMSAKISLRKSSLCICENRFIQMINACDCPNRNK